MTDYEQGFRDGVERAAQRICIRCQESKRLEEQGPAKVPCHQSPDGTWVPCFASDIRALTPGYWRNFLLTPESMAAMFHEIHGRLAPKFGYKARRDDIYTAETQVNIYRAALQYIATHSKDRNAVDGAIQALLEAPHKRLWDPRPWDEADEANRGLTIAVCAEMLDKFGTSAQ